MNVKDKVPYSFQALTLVGRRQDAHKGTRKVAVE
jgi:hypothetical protein